MRASEINDGQFSRDMMRVSKVCDESLRGTIQTL